MAVIDYTHRLIDDPYNAKTFLRMWVNGEFSEIRDELPDFQFVYGVNVDQTFLTSAYGLIQGMETPAVVEGTPTYTWLNEGAYVYRTQLSGGYLKGIPNTFKEFSFRVYPELDFRTEVDAEQLAAQIADILRNDQFRRALCARQAQGRFFYLRHTQRSVYWTGWTGRHWSDDLIYATRYRDAIEVLRTLEDLPHTDGTVPACVEICLEDTSDYVDPINHEGFPFVVLKSLSTSGVCITSALKDENPTILASGRRGYDLIGYAPDMKTAQAMRFKKLGNL